MYATNINVQSSVRLLKKILIAVLLGVLAILYMAYPMPAQAQPIKDFQRINELPEIGENLPVLELFWAKRDAVENLKRIQLAAETVTGFGLNSEELLRVYANDDAIGHWKTPFTDEAPQVKVKLSPQYDEIRVVNRDLVDKVSEDGIAENKAIAIATDYLGKLAESGLVDRKLYNLDDLQVGYGQIVEGSMDGKRKIEHITEYRVTFRPNFKGIQFANAGVRLAVNQSGQLSGLRLGGVSLTQWDGKTADLRVSANDIEELFKKTIPEGMEAVVVWSRPMYVIPEDEQKAQVEPLQVFSYVLKTKINDQEVVSRRKTVGFSFTKPGNFVDFSAPVKEHTGVKLER